MVKDLLQELVELLKEQQREKWIEELKTKYYWCGIHNKAITYQPMQGAQQSYQLGSLGALGSLGSLGLMGAQTSNTISYTTSYGPPCCPDCGKDAGKSRKDDLLRKLGHKW